MTRRLVSIGEFLPEKRLFHQRILSCLCLPTATIISFLEKTRLSTMAKPRVMVTGADGQLGRELRKLAPKFSDFDFDFLTRQDLSVDDETAVKEILQRTSPAFCINCAAYTAVDKAES